MSWNEKEARKRLTDAYKETKGLTLSPLVREMDLHQLPLLECKVVAGVHLYLDVVSFEDELESAKQDQNKLKKLLRDVHVYQRLVRDLLKDFEGSVRVHFQGVRLHAVFHKPYDTEKDAGQTRLDSAREFVSQARELAALIGAEVDRLFEFEAGFESGDTIAARNGQHGARELMFVGDAANVAAKILTGVAGDRLGPTAESLESSATPAALPAKWKQRVIDEVKAFPLTSFELFSPQEPIDVDRLGARTADLEPGISLYADIKGFTKHIAALKTDDEKIEALRLLHAVRGEMHEVSVRAYAGDFIQYQGDRIQSVHYEAKGTKNYAWKVVEGAAAMRRAFGVAREELTFTLDVTMGAAAGRTFVTKVGVKGDKDLFALGRSVTTAASLQDGVATDGTLAIDEELWDLLDEETQKEFTKVGDHYEATLELKKLVAKADRAMFEGRVSIGGSNLDGRTVRPDVAGIQPTRSYLRAK